MSYSPYTPHQQALMVMGQRLPAVEAALKAEREKVRVLREALQEISDARTRCPPWKIAMDALANARLKGGDV